MTDASFFYSDWYILIIILEHAKLHCVWCVYQDRFILYSVILILNLLGQPFLIPHIINIHDPFSKGEIGRCQSVCHQSINLTNNWLFLWICSISNSIIKIYIFDLCMCVLLNKTSQKDTEIQLLKHDTHHHVQCNRQRNHRNWQKNGNKIRKQQLLPYLFNIYNITEIFL